MRSSGSSHPTEVNEGRASAFDFQHRRNIGKLRHRGWGRTPERGSLGVLYRTPQGMQRRTKPKSLSPMSTTATVRVPCLPGRRRIYNILHDSHNDSRNDAREL